MANHGDDCYFFYYSTCTKGDSCPFRHCEAAMGSETVCNLWQEGRCFRAICKFRHMEITKNRKEIPCYWENQPAGCQKPHCAFFHEKPRYVDGVFVPPSRSLCKNDEQPHEEPAPPPAAPLPTTSNPQLRGVLKTETQEPVPSPTHPPVVINPTDDDEDEDDQFSEEGEDGKVGSSPRKLPKSDGSLNFGVSTLEEIRLRKALKASMKRAGYPIQSADTSASGEKENIQSLYRRDLNEAREGSLVFNETGRPRSSVAERLGRKVPNTDAKIGESFPLKKSLAERLGKVVDEKEPQVSPQKASKPIKQRLGLLDGSVASTQPAETNMECRKSPDHIRIKTLEEIKQEKAAKSQSQNDGPSVTAPEITKTITTKATKGVKRAIAVREDSIGSVKIFSEALHTKKKKEEEQTPIPKKVKPAPEKALRKSPAETKTAGPGPEATNLAKVRVKTLEEIRREKATRVQAQQALEAENKSSGTEENGARKTGLLHLNKLASQSNVTTQKSPEGTEMPVKSLTAALETSSASRNNVKVKSFEEIMREKRLRQQEIKAERSPSSSAGAKEATSPPQGPTKDPPVTDLTPPSDPKSSPEHTSNTKVRPKLNVKPSVVKPVQVKPGQKRKGTGRSAVAEVKPLNSTSTVLKEPLHKTPHRDGQGFLSSSAETQPNSASPRQETNPAVSVTAPKVACTVPQSPLLKSPTQAPKTRSVSRTSSTSAAASSSAVDDFEMLISEFTDDHLEEDMDPSIGEDDLLQELSEMIGS
ncbi:hypothetical protein Q5P01_023989 [Channa striata]|uniref:C3H1-type domain-containing protein n=1 Tax=Channa striata TaxID=64152 RepID=A0AA88LP50_CHASR|nr:hypothetical protein Q5P01_023989 [Channa striata]